MSDESIGSRILNSSFALGLGALLGVVLIVVAGAFVYFSEDKAIKNAAALQQAGGEATTIAAEPVDPANNGKLVHLVGKAASSKKVTDPDLGISADGFVLSRTVEMSQLKENKKEKKEKKETKVTYELEQFWSKEKPANSKSFNTKVVPRHNPTKKPYEDISKIPNQAVTVGAFTLTPGQVEKLSPDTDLPVTQEMLAALPEGVKEKAKITPDGQLFVGDGTPDSPQVGDVRIRYKVAKLQPVSIMAKQNQSTFEPYAPEGRDNVDLIQKGEKSAESMLESAQAGNQMVVWLLRVGGLVLMALGIFLVFRWQVNRAAGIPPEGIASNIGFFLLAGLIAIPLVLVASGSRLVSDNAALGGGLLGGGVVGLGLVIGGTRLLKPGLFGGGKTWSPEERKAFQKVALNPENGETRLELAELLEKRGDPMGEFIRVNQELEALPDNDERREELDGRWNTLLTTHGRAWFQPLRRLRLEPKIMDTFYPGLWMHHGIIDEVLVDLAGILPGRAEQLFAAVPGLRVLALHNVRMEPGIGGWKDITYNPDVPAIVKVPQLKQIGVLRMSSLGLGLVEMEAIASSPNLVNLTELDFGYNKIGPKGAEMLAKSSTLKKLRVLELRGCEIEEAGAIALAGSANLARLTSLNLGANLIGRGGVKALAGSANLKLLETLALDDNKLGSIGAQAIASSPVLRRLTTLDFSRNEIGSEGALALAKAANLARLTTLKLTDNKLGGAGVRMLATSPHLGQLKVLDLSFNEIDDEGGQALATWEVIKQLEELTLSYNKIGDAGLTALAGWPGLAGLKKLTLRENKSGSDGIKALALSPHLKGLKELDLSNNDVGLAGAKALAASTVLKNLEQLWIQEANLTPEGEKILRKRFEDVLHT